MTFLKILLMLAYLSKNVFQFNVLSFGQLKHRLEFDLFYFLLRFSGITQMHIKCVD